MLNLSQEKLRFKDKCDECGKFDFLKGVNNKCLCENCRKQYNLPVEEKQLSIFDMEVLENGQQRRNSKISK